jgi:TonB-dependent SusC/RagA subfamily outer membrane receptor
MPALFLFLFKVNIALVLFCLGYYLVLRHLTFYTLNRIYLVIAILFSTLYPNINLSDFAQRHQQLTEPVQTVILNWKAPAENFVKPLYQPNYWQWAELIFWAGVFLFAARMMMQLFSLYKLYRRSRPGELHDYPVRLIKDDISPFSFWRSIFVNPTKLSPADLKSVLEHEQVHVSQWHTLDILLAELSTVFYWFNPGVWLMKKAVRENIEFTTDRKILQKGTDSKQYQYSLVSVSLATAPNTIVNHFNISTIKKRIIMMNAKRSAGYNLTRYILLIPAVTALLLVFNLSKAEISKKGLHTFKSIATAITNVTGINNEKPHLATIKEKTTKPVVAKSAIKSVDTIYSGKSKDGKKSFMMTADLKPDSIAYVINGTSASKEALKALDPGRKISMELLPPEKAKEFFPEADSKRYVLFVTTDDSETGKKLKGKLDKSMGGGMLSRVKNITVHATDESSNLAQVAGHSNISTTESSDDGAVVLKSYGGNVSAVVVEDDVNINPKTTTSLKKHVYITSSPKVTVTVKSSDTASHDIDGFYNKLVRTNNEVTIDNTSSALIIIDGKEVKSLKNLSQSDIKSMSILQDESATKLYGDKAKNGVVVITTKKGK